MLDRILVVDDESVLRGNVIRALKRSDHEAVGANSGETALERLATEDFAMVITDLKMPGMSGLDLLRRIADDFPETLVLVITAYASLETALEALRLGAQDYLLKPLSMDELSRKVSGLLHHRELEQRVRRLRQEIHGQYQTETMVAESTAMQPVMELIRKAATSRSAVLISGESGTGKELVARALHDSAPWSDKDFMAINLAAQPAELVDAALFGHERGAYTGANRSREGVFRAANGGTVFLDEIGELPESVQVKLLRVLQNGEVLPLGSDRAIAVDFRLVVATNRPLEEAIATGGFRKDLYYRLNVLRIDLPPLKDRLEDIAPLARRFMEMHARSMGKPTPKLTNEALRRLQGYEWPGNIRELSNIIERAVLLTDSEWVEPDDLVGPRLLTSSESPTDLKAAMDNFERRHIQRVLHQCDGNKTRAAELLGVHIATLYRHLERLESSVTSS